MNENAPLKITPEFVLDIVLRRRWILLAPLCMALIGGIIFAVVTPKLYRAKTLILVEGQRVPQDFVQSIVTEETSARINTISQQILSRTNLEKIIKEFSLFTDIKDQNLFMEDKVSILRKRIEVDVISGRSRQTSAFEISFKGQDPRRVMQVVNGLAASFIDENLKVRESQAVGTSDFLDSELAAMRSRLEQLEEGIKNYRRNNMGELPEQLETNLRILERLQDNFSDRQQSIREAKIRLAELKSQASSRQPSIVVIGEGQAQREGTASLEDLLAQLEELKSRYTERHPDIIRLKKQIADMESGSKIETGAGGSRSSRRIPLELRKQMQEVEREIQVFEADIKEIEDQITVYQLRVEKTPKREQELLSLRRDYQNIQASYDSLLNRKLEADIAVNMERKQKGEQFRVVDYATTPQRPVEPDMKKIFVLVIFAGLGLGGGVAFLLEYMDSSIKKPDEIENYFEIPVLTTIPLLIDNRQMMIRKLNNYGSLAFACFTSGLLGVFGIVCVKGADRLVAVFSKVFGG